MLGGIFFVFLLFSFNGWTQQSEANKRIHYGDESEEKYVLYYEESDGMRSGSCTASLIEKKYILLAAHCFLPGFPRKTVTYGCFDLKKPDCKKVKVVSWLVHPDFQNKNGQPTMKPLADIAVAKLETALSITPIKLPTGEKKSWKPTGVAYLVGYGLNENGRLPYNQQSTHLPIMDAHNYVNPNEKIIVKATKSQTDLGDSGGPLIIDNTLYGVLSGGNVNPKTMKTGLLIYMSINHYRNFIDSAIKTLEENS